MIGFGLKLRLLQQKKIYVTLDIGAKPEEIKEALYHCTPYIGLEKVRSALEKVNEAFQKAPNFFVRSEDRGFNQYPFFNGLQS